MALNGIISIAGLPGLHKILSHTKNGLIVESLLDGKRRPVYSSQKVSTLEDISVYTKEEDVPLKDVFKLIFEKQNGEKAPDHKTDPAELREYLTSVVKTVDHDRVYNSDVAKLFHWYNILIDKDLLKDAFEEKEEEKTEEKKETTKAVAAKSATRKKPATASTAVAPGKKAGSQKKAPTRSTGQTRTAGRNS